MKQLTLSASILCATLCASCSSGVTTSEKSERIALSSKAQSYLNEGSLVISRQVPNYGPQPLGKTSEAAQSLESHALGFVPASLVFESAPKVIINNSSRTVSLVESGKVTVSKEVEGVATLAPGRYKIVHKQRNPLWYAPDSYFTARKLEVPAAGSKARYLRGALGDFVLYIDKNLPMHDGPVWSSDVGGVKLDQTTLSKIYYLMPVGSEVIVE